MLINFIANFSDFECKKGGWHKRYNKMDGPPPTSVKTTLLIKYH